MASPKTRAARESAPRSLAYFTPANKWKPFKLGNTRRPDSSYRGARRLVALQLRKVAKHSRQLDARRAANLKPKKEHADAN